jgi:hypothetical protein
MMTFLSLFLLFRRLTTFHLRPRPSPRLCHYHRRGLCHDHHPGPLLASTSWPARFPSPSSLLSQRQLARYYSYSGVATGFGASGHWLRGRPDTGLGADGHWLRGGSAEHWLGGGRKLAWGLPDTALRKVGHWLGGSKNIKRAS